MPSWPLIGADAAVAAEKSGVRVYDEVLFTVDKAKASRVDRVGLDELELQERAHLQEWVIAHPDVIGPGTQIVTAEYDRWQTATGTPVLDRLDILAIDPNGRLFVVELKRAAAPHTIHMQAINYAAMVSRLTVTDVADLLAASAAFRGGDGPRLRTDGAGNSAPAY